ncbi:MAG TPA: glutaredoxin domain-containing protein [Acidobacteriota bacterium]|nr:glutaredoxin domain-containing protein [Acidobacteriota bacterium]
MKNAIKNIIVLVLCFSFSWLASSQVYKWRDKQGNLIISSTPPPPGIKSETRKVTAAQQTPKPKDVVSTKPAKQEVDDPELKEKKPYGNVRVTLYVTDWCPYCRQASAYLKSLRVSLVEYDVEKDSAKNQERLRKTGGRTGVPVIDIEGIIQVGFSAENVKSAVEEKRII